MNHFSVALWGGSAESCRRLPEYTLESFIKKVSSFHCLCERHNESVTVLILSSARPPHAQLLFVLHNRVLCESSERLD